LLLASGLCLLLASAPRPFGSVVMSARSKARKRALDVLFEAELRGSPVLELLAERITMGDPPVSPYAADLVRGVTVHSAQIDELLSAQVNEIIHHEEFQRLEGSWRGLKYLLNNTETGEQLKIKVFNVITLLLLFRLWQTFARTWLRRKNSKMVRPICSVYGA